MDDTRLKQLMDQLEIDQMQEDLEHPSWVMLSWAFGREEGGDPTVQGPYGSAVAALEAADKVRQEMANASGRHMLTDYTPTFSICPLYGEQD